MSARLSSKQARSRQRGKTDPIDAIAIARVLLREPKLPPFQPDGSERDLKLLVDHRDQLHHERTRTADRLHADLAIAYPGHQRSVGKALTSRRALQRVEKLVEDDPSLLAGLIGRRWTGCDRSTPNSRTSRPRSRAWSPTATGAYSTSWDQHPGRGAAPRRGRRCLPVPHSGELRLRQRHLPDPASSGRNDRRRLDRRGNRRLNEVLSTVALTPTRHEPSSPRLPGPEARRRQGATRGPAMPRAATLRRGLPPARRGRTTAT